MGRMRTRPDESKRPGYITREGYRALEEEAERLWNVERPKLARAVAVAAAEGDRSENAEYIYGKKKLAEVDRRLQFLGNRMKVLRVADGPPPNDGKVYFGCWVDLEDEQGIVHTYRVVGPDEFDADRGWISMHSPVGKALLGKEEGDDVTIEKPSGTATFEIVGVRVLQCV